MKKAAVIFLLLSAFFFVNRQVYAVEDYQALRIATKVARGKIANIDYLGSKITINTAPPGQKEERLSFAVTEKTKVMRQKVNVSFSELMVGDEVMIEYYDDPKAIGAQEAERIELIPR